MKKYSILLIFLSFILSCNNINTDSSKKQAAKLVAEVTKPSSPKLDAYWYQGKAELNRYELQQNRYQDVHPGEAIMIFVTEDFLTDKQVKNDNYKNSNSINVIKNNIIKRFATGIYDYSIMTSVFTPVDEQKYPQTLKETTSVQDWCGQAFMQVNWLNNQYQAQVHSYFENESDQQFKVPFAILEDELFNRIRMNPQGLPIGKIKILPSLHITRLLHQPFEVQDAEASLHTYNGKDFLGENLQSYQVAFAKGKRSLEIIFENKSPYIIAGWKENYPSFDGKVRETIAKRTKTVVAPYWQQHNLADTHLRDDLGVQGF